jgi:hypothetical protein
MGGTADAEGMLTVHTRLGRRKRWWRKLWGKNWSGQCAVLLLEIKVKILNHKRTQA